MVTISPPAKRQLTVDFFFFHLFALRDSFKSLSNVMVANANNLARFP